MRNLTQMLNEGIKGEGITLEEAKMLITPGAGNLDALLDTANQLTRYFFGSQISMCAIYPAKVGLCSGDCAFCAQSVHHNCDIKPVDAAGLDGEEIINNAAALHELGVRRYSLVTSGEQLTDQEFSHILYILQRLKKETEIELCASLGALTPDRAMKLIEAGVSRYHHNIETSPSYFPSICSSHSYEDKINTISIARQAGMEICSGGIIAMGETKAQRVEMAFTLKSLNVDCVPINILNPIPGTRLENQKPLSLEEILRTIAVFRLIMPDMPLRFAGGREKAMGNEEYQGYVAGINAMIAGNYLTTPGKPLERELENVKKAGFAIE